MTKLLQRNAAFNTPFYLIYDRETQILVYFKNEKVLDAFFIRICY